MGTEVRHLLQRARYGSENKGHFGLNLPCYTHWTSPIRRYADLVNHRILHAWLDGSDSPYDTEELEEIASHLNQKSDEFRDRKKNSFKARATNKLLNATEAQLLRLDSGDFSNFVKKLADETIPLTRMRVNVLLTRVNKDAVIITDITRVLFVQFSGDLWTELKKGALQWLEQNQEESLQVLHHGHKLCGWPDLEELSWNAEKKGPDHIPQFSVEVSIEQDGRVFKSDKFTSLKRRIANKQAALSLISKIAGVPLSSKENKGNKAVDTKTVAITNPKGRLIEISQKSKVAPPQFDMTKKGAPHNMEFTCVATFEIDGQTYKSGPCTGKGKKEAERLASADLLNKLPASFIDSSKKEEAPILLNTTSNPISNLTEWAQKNGKSLPEFKFKQIGEDHSPLFTCTCKMSVTDKPNEWEGVGTTKKVAKEQAAKNACKDLPAQ